MMESGEGSSSATRRSDVEDYLTQRPLSLYTISRSSSPESMAHMSRRISSSRMGNAQNSPQPPTHPQRGFDYRRPAEASSSRQNNDHAFIDLTEDVEEATASGNEIRPQRRTLFD